MDYVGGLGDFLVWVFVLLLVGLVEFWWFCLFAFFECEGSLQDKV